jgi:hypothetical protein
MGESLLDSSLSTLATDAVYTIPDVKKRRKTNLDATGGQARRDAHDRGLHGGSLKTRPGSHALR